jgi:hypothetical protein
LNFCRQPVPSFRDHRSRFTLDNGTDTTARALSEGHAIPRLFVAPGLAQNRYGLTSAM